MKNLTINEFVNWMYEKREIVFEFNGKFYNFEISYNFINVYQIFDNKDGIELYSTKYDKVNYFNQIDNLLKMPLFEGKTIFEIESEVNVISNS